MKKQGFTIIFALCTAFLFAQNHIGVNLRLGAAKTWKVSKKLRFEAEQQLQLNPELTSDQKKFGDIFNEINLFPDDDSDGDGQDDNDDDDNAIDNPFGPLDDAPYRVLLEWRSATSVAGEYRFANWLRAEQSYTLNYRKDGDVRHSFQTALKIVEKVNDDFEFVQRLGFQYTSRKNKKKNETIWEEDFVARTGFSWDFKKKHTWETQVGVNGAFDEGKWEWDRLRVDTGLAYRYTQTQSFKFTYRFQQTLDSKARISHGMGIDYSLNF